MFDKAFITAIAPIFLVLGGASAAAAAPASFDEARVLRVKAADLDLRKPADRKLLNRRIEWAVMAVCPFPAGPGMAEMMHFSACRRKALAVAQPQVAMLVDKASGPAVLARADIR